MKISATILVKGSPQHLKSVVEALKSLDEVLIYDNGACRTVLTALLPYPNVRIVEGVFSGFGTTHNTASHLAKNDWILSIDSDEVPSQELIKEIQDLNPQDDAVYSLPRKNYYNGKWITGCGWWPDRALRLYNKKKTQFTDAKVHESIMATKVIPLQNPLIHYSYDSISDFLTKMESYSGLFAKQRAGKEQSSPCKAVLHGIFAFFKSYFLKKGIKNGYEGFLISAYNGHTAFYKYMKLYEANLRIRLCPEENGSSFASENKAQK